MPMNKNQQFCLKCQERLTINPQECEYDKKSTSKGYTYLRKHECPKCEGKTCRIITKETYDKYN